MTAAADTARRDRDHLPSSTSGWDVSVRSGGCMGSDSGRSSTGRLDAPGVARRPLERLGLTDAYLTTSYSLSSGLRLLGFVLLAWGLIGIYGPGSRAAGTFGLATFVFVFLATALAAGNVWAEVFVYPTLAQIAPDMLSGADFETEATSI